MLAKKRTLRGGREGIRNKEREEEREADGAVCFAYRSAKIPRATTRSGANNIRRESHNGDATRERRSRSPSLFLSHGTNGASEVESIFMPAQLQRILMKLRYRSFTTRTVPGARVQEEEEDEEEGTRRGGR